MLHNAFHENPCEKNDLVLMGFDEHMALKNSAQFSHGARRSVQFRCRWLAEQFDL